MPSIAIDIKVKINKEKLERLLRELKPRADAILDKSAFDIQMTAQSLALVDTGFMKSQVLVQNDGDLRRKINAGAPYSFWVEVRWKAFMGPAAEAHRASFISAWSSLV